MRVLIVVPDQDLVSGNWVSARRFQHGLETHGHQVAVQEVSLQPGESFKRYWLGFAPDITILLHAYRSGKPWLDMTNGLNALYMVMLTGTDINHGLEDPQQSQVIRTVLHQAAFVLLQNSLLASQLSARHPDLTANLRVLPPGISLGTRPYPLREEHGLAHDQPLFLCPAGLRPVKGVLNLLEMFDPVALQAPACQLAFCGPVLDEPYGKRFLAALKDRPWARYLGAIPPDAMASAMREADVILNNSETEGLPNALLEAATLGIPILARKIPGNAAVVKHECNGLLYASQEEFVEAALQLLRKEKRQQLSRPEPHRYNPEEETQTLIALLEEAVAASAGGTFKDTP